MIFGLRKGNDSLTLSFLSNFSLAAFVHMYKYIAKKSTLQAI